MTLIWQEEEGRRTGADLSTLRMLTVMVLPTWNAPSLTDRKMKSVLSPSAPLWVYWKVLLCTSVYGKLSPARHNQYGRCYLHFIKTEKFVRSYT